MLTAGVAKRTPKQQNGEGCIGFVSNGAYSPSAERPEPLADQALLESIEIVCRILQHSLLRGKLHACCIIWLVARREYARQRATRNSAARQARIGPHSTLLRYRH